jgi:hypothetical protein
VLMAPPAERPRKELPRVRRQRETRCAEALILALGTPRAMGFTTDSPSSPAPPVATEPVAGILQPIFSKASAKLWHHPRQHSRLHAGPCDVNSAIVAYDLLEPLLRRHPGHGPDFLRPQIGQSLRCHFGR